MQQNPLLNVTFAVPFDQIRAGHVEPAIDQLLTDTRAKIDEIIALEDARDYDNTLGALEAATEGLHFSAVATAAAAEETTGQDGPEPA